MVSVAKLIDMGDDVHSIGEIILELRKDTAPKRAPIINGATSVGAANACA